MTETKPLKLLSRQKTGAENQETYNLYNIE